MIHQLPLPSASSADEARSFFSAFIVSWWWAAHGQSCWYGGCERLWKYACLSLSQLHYLVRWVLHHDSSKEETCAFKKGSILHCISVVFPLSMMLEWSFIADQLPLVAALTFGSIETGSISHGATFWHSQKECALDYLVAACVQGRIGATARRFQSSVHLSSKRREEECGSTRQRRGLKL